MKALGRECEHCENGHKPRWCGYLAVWHQKLGVKGLLELTNIAATEIAAIAKEKGSLRGQGITLSRKNNMPNGKLNFQLHHTTLIEEQIPKSIDVALALARLWKMDAKLFDAPPVKDLKIRGQIDEDLHVTNGKKSA